MLPHSSSIRDFYHFDDTKDNQRFFSHCTASMSGVQRCCMSPLPPSPLSSFFLPSPHLHSTHAPLLCVLLLHLCSDYSSIDSHADVSIGRYAAIDTHTRLCRCQQGTTNLIAMCLVFGLLVNYTKALVLPLCYQKKVQM